MVQTARFSFKLRSTAQILVSALVGICVTILGGLLKCFSMGVCSDQYWPRRTRVGLPSSTSAGNSRPVSRTLIQLQQVPVQTLSRMQEPMRSFHWPRYRVAGLFQERGGTGGRSVNGLPLANALALRERHCWR